MDIRKQIASLKFLNIRMTQIVWRDLTESADRVIYVWKEWRPLEIIIRR